MRGMLLIDQRRAIYSLMIQRLFEEIVKMPCVESIILLKKYNPLYIWDRALSHLARQDTSSWKEACFFTVEKAV
jgi:hypothetical protein